MNIELGVLHDGGVMLVSNQPLPHLIKRVEFYSDQKLCTLVYRENDEQSTMLPYEVPEEMIDAIDVSPDVMIYSLFPDHEPIGYSVPLIKVEAAINTAAQTA